MANIVITGSTKGIGFGLAKEFAQRGHQVVITGRTESSVNETLARLQATQGNVVGTVCNTTLLSDVHHLWEFACASFGHVDIWINNAGVAKTTQRITEFSEQDIRAMVSTNMLGTMFGSQVAVSGMLQQGGGKLFNVLGGGSDGEYFKGMGIYGATKRGLDYLTNALVKELKGTSIIVGKIRPGMIVTEGMLREAQADRDSFNRQRRVLNILSDKIEAVAPYLVDKMLACEKSGVKIKWLTLGRLTKKFIQASYKKPEDKFSLLDQ